MKNTPEGINSRLKAAEQTSDFQDRVVEILQAKKKKRILKMRIG